MFHCHFVHVLKHMIFFVLKTSPQHRATLDMAVAVHTGGQFFADALQRLAQGTLQFLSLAGGQT